MRYALSVTGFGPELTARNLLSRKLLPLESQIATLSGPEPIVCADKRSLSAIIQIGCIAVFSMRYGLCRNRGQELPGRRMRTIWTWAHFMRQRGAVMRSSRREDWGGRGSEPRSGPEVHLVGSASTRTIRRPVQ